MGKTRIAKDELVEKLKEELGIKEKPRPEDDQPMAEKVEEKKEEKETKKTEKPGKAKPRSKKYQEVAKDLDRNKTYPIAEAVEMVKKLSYSKFDGTLEAHINTIQTGPRTEAKAPVIHMSLGKLNQPTEELTANIKTLLQTLGKTKIKKVSLSPTMGPSVKVDLSSL